MDLIWGNSFVLSELFSSMVGPDVLNGKLIKALINLMLEIEKFETRGCTKFIF